MHQQEAFIIYLQQQIKAGKRVERIESNDGYSAVGRRSFAGTTSHQ